MAASYISVPRDLTKVKSKIIFNLTKRQLICFSLAAVVGLPTFFAVKHFTSTTVGAFLMMVVMMPFFFFALYEKNGQYLEKILKNFIKSTFIRPKKRLYKTDNYYRRLENEGKARREVERILKYRFEGGDSEEIKQE